MTKHADFTNHTTQRSGTLTSTSGSTASFVASTDTVDSYGDIVVQSGIDLSDFRRNPVILFGHDARQPIGKATSVRMNTRGELVADIRFADKVPGSLGELAHGVAEMVKAGFIRAVSIGFTSKKREPMYDDDGRYTGTKFLESVLKEISVVSVPANPDALAVARAAGLGDRAIGRLLGTAPGPQGNPRAHSHAQRIAARQIRVHQMVGEARAAHMAALRRDEPVEKLAERIIRRRKAQIAQDERRAEAAQERAESIRAHQAAARAFDAFSLNT